MREQEAGVAKQSEAMFDVGTVDAESSQTQFAGGGTIPPVAADEPQRKPTASERGFTDPPDNIYIVDPRDLTPLQVAQMIQEQPSRWWEIRSVVAKVRGPEFMALVTAASTMKISASDPVIAGMLVNRVAAGTENLRIEGTKAFKQRIVQELYRIARTNVGSRAIEELLLGKDISTIKFGVESGSQGGGTTTVDPGWEIHLYGPNDVPITTTFSTILVHELVHQIHEHRGEKNHDDPIQHPLYSNREEENTIDGDPTKKLTRPPLLRVDQPPDTLLWSRPVHLSENAYREETGQAERFGHHGVVPDNGDRGEVISAFNGLEVFAEGGNNDFAPLSIDEINRICDAMGAVRDQYQVEPERIMQVRDAAKVALGLFIHSLPTRADLMSQLTAGYKAVNLAIKDAIAADEKIGPALDVAGLGRTLEPPIDALADLQLERGRIVQICNVVWWSETIETAAFSLLQLLDTGRHVIRYS